MDNKIIFLVDPNKSHRDRIISLLNTGSDIEFREFDSALLMLHVFNTFIPDLVILELNLPTVNGLSTLNYIRETERLKTLPVIICTNDYDPEARAIADELGHFGIFFYPLDEMELQRSVQHALSSGKYIKLIEKETIEHLNDEKLIITLDDDVSIRTVFESIIPTKLKHKCIGFEDPLEALEELKKGNLKPDLLLLDMNMPQMDGLTFLRTLKEFGNNSFLPVIACTGETNATTVAEFIKLGIVDFLAKPFDIDVATQKISNALQL